MTTTPRKLFSISSRLLVAFSLMAALGGALTLGFTPFTGEAEATFSHDCFCDRGQATQIRWGLGDTCQLSRDDLESQAMADYYNDAPTVCDPPCPAGPGGQGMGCDPILVVTGSCTWNSGYGKFVTDGYISYGCLTCP